MLEQPEPQPPDFEAIERRQNLANRADIDAEIAQRSERLRTRILHFAG